MGMGRRHILLGPPTASGGGGASSTTLNTITPCAACKLLRRRCAEECPFSPYFSPHEPHKFAAVHKVFGASNVSKMLMEVPDSQRADAANSLVYEANVRLRDPVYGCMGAISTLQRQVHTLQAELNAVRAEILKYKYREAANSILNIAACTNSNSTTNQLTPNITKTDPQYPCTTIATTTTSDTKNSNSNTTSDDHPTNNINNIIMPAAALVSTTSNSSTVTVAAAAAPAEALPQMVVVPSHRAQQQPAPPTTPPLASHHVPVSSSPAASLYASTPSSKGAFSSLSSDNATYFD